MKTALSIIQSAMKRMNLSAPASLVNQTDPAILQQIELLIAVCEELRQAKCFPQQKRKYSFTTEADRAQYPLPLDFYSSLFETVWNEDTAEELEGPVSDDEFTYELYSEASDDELTFRIFGPDVERTTKGQLYLLPTPTSEVNLSFEYLSKNLFLPANWTSSDTTHCYETISADTDLCVYDDDLVKVGFMSKYRQENGGDWQAFEAEYRGKIEAAAGRFEAPRRGSFAGRMKQVRRIPEKGWSI